MLLYSHINLSVSVRNTCPSSYPAPHPLQVRRVVALVTEMAGACWWPQEVWGPFSPDDVGVLCPYQDQVGGACRWRELDGEKVGGDRDMV